MTAPDARAAIFKDPINGDLWASVMDENEFLVSRSTDDGVTWSGTPANLNQTITEGQTQLTSFSDGGVDYLGLAGSEDGDGDLEAGRYSQYIFYRLPLSDAASFSAVVRASAVLSMGTIPTAGETINIGGRVYTFQVTPIADTAGNVAIGGTLAITQSNLVNAINGSGAAGPTTYAVSTFPHNAVRIGGFAGGTTATVSAMETGTGGNAITLAETMTAIDNGFVGAVTNLSGGSSPWVREPITVTQGSSNAVVHADDELSLITHNNLVYLATETQRSSESSTQASLDPQVVVFRRSLGGTWQQSTVKLDQSSNTLDRKRPVVAILDSTIYVMAVDNGQTNSVYWTSPVGSIPIGLSPWASPKPLFNTPFEKHRNHIVPRGPLTTATNGGLPVLIDWAWDNCGNCSPVSVQDNTIWQTMLPNGGNQAPGAFAGNNKSVDASPATDLGATVTTDSIGSPVTWTWSVISGPAGPGAGVNFSQITGSCASTACLLPTTAAFSGGLGTYVLRLTAIETTSGPNLLTNYDDVSVQVNNLVNTPPVLTVSNPKNGDKYSVGAPVTFAATAVDGGSNISSSIVWTSSRDGIIGFGGSFVKTNLSSGTHIIKANVTDGQNEVTSSNISVVVGTATPPPPPPPPDPDNPFIDDDGHVFENAIEWLAMMGITQGCNPPTNNRFCPNDNVTRGQMAAFLVRALDLPAYNGPDRFRDDNTSVFEANIERLAQAGITLGCNPPTNNRFCPEDFVTRGQMAAFLVRAFDLPAYNGPDRFRDDNGNVFEANIERLAQAGITLGCNPPTNNRYCPSDNVTRGQMAAFLKRAFEQ